MAAKLVDIYLFIFSIPVDFSPPYFTHSNVKSPLAHFKPSSSFIYLSCTLCVALENNTDLPESGHGLAGDDLIVAEACDEAQCLVLALPSFQLSQNQGSEDLHILNKNREKQFSWTEGKNEVKAAFKDSMKSP